MTFEGALTAVQIAGLAVLLASELAARGFRRGLAGDGDRARQRRNRAYLAAALASGLASKALVAPLQSYVPVLVDVASISTVLDLVGCFVVADLIGWTSHWLKHRYERLWRLHFQHHRERHYDLWLVTHTHAIEVVISASILLGSLILLGFSARAIELYLVVYSLAKAWQHSSWDLTLGRVLDKVIVGPAYHRYHHEVGSQCNYANVSTLWDVVFRTARFPESAKAPDLELGTGNTDEPFGFVDELTWVLKPAPGTAPAATSAPLTTLPAPTTAG